MTRQALGSIDTSEGYGQVSAFVGDAFLNGGAGAEVSCNTCCVKLLACRDFRSRFTGAETENGQDE